VLLGGSATLAAVFSSDRVGSLIVALVTMMVSATAFAEPRAAVRIAVAAPTVEDAPAITSKLTTPAPRTHRHALYVEVLGKGGPYGVGYDRQLRGWIGIGAVASFVALDGQRMYSITPYVSLYPVGRGRHRWFVDAGTQLTRLATPSPVPEWDGESETGIGGEVSTGYEYRGPVFVRAFGMAVVGKNGFSPWAGLSVGFTL
jgi:hypothetical protein